jgi:hypothetical protein
VPRTDLREALRYTGGPRSGNVEKESKLGTESLDESGGSEPGFPRRPRGAVVHSESDSTDI